MKKYCLTLTLFLSAAISYAQWQPDVQLTSNSSRDLGSFNNSKWIASQGSEVNVVWASGEALDVWHIRSVYEGVTWGSMNRVSDIGNDEWYPSIALDGTVNPVIHVVWSDNRSNWEIYYKSSTNGGTSWGSESRLTNGFQYSTYPSIAASGSSVHLVWSENIAFENNAAYYNRSTDGGVSWQGTSGIQLSNNPSTSEVFPSISLSDTHLHVVWTENDEIYYRQSLTNGTSWNPIVRLTNDPSYSRSPCISASAQDIHVAWQDRRDGHWGIYYKRSTDGGSSWGEDTQLTNTPAPAYTPSLSVSGTVVHVVWEDNRDGNKEVYYKRSTNGGASWGEDTRLTNNSADSYNPSVAVSGTVVNVVWEDNRDGNSDIYYKRDPTGNVTGIEDIGSEFPEEFRLAQNYPNPFNPSTLISYQLPVSCYVTLKVFDVLGNEVATLVDEYKPAGIYNVEFRMQNLELSSGIYFYQLTAGDFIQTKKMLMIK